MPQLNRTLRNAYSVMAYYMFYLKFPVTCINLVSRLMTVWRIFMQKSDVSTEDYENKHVKGNCFRHGSRTGCRITVVTSASTDLL